MTVKREAINRENRTVEVAFSSEKAIEDFPGYFHILDHSEGAVDLARLNDGAPVLLDHDTRSHVGVVERAWVDDDRVGRALLRFGESARATEAWKDVIDGIKRHISVGANITGKVVLEEEGKERTVYRVQGWQPREISFVPVPADHSVGVGRSDEPKPKPARNPRMDNHDHGENRADLERATRSTGELINQIYAIGEQYNCADLAREFAGNSDKWNEAGMAEFRRRAVDLYVERKEKEITDLEEGKGKSPTEIGLSSKETQRYSVTRALNAVLEKSWKGAEFELECSQEITRALDREPNGFFVPMEVQVRGYNRQPTGITREMTTGGSGTGAEYVGTRHSPENFIEQLRNNVVAMRAGARMLPGLRQNLDIPKKTAGATFAWLAESGTVTLSDLGTGVVQLSPKTVGGGTQASRRMLKQSLPAIDDLIMQDLAEGAAETIDLGALQGSGASNQPTGVINATGINTQVVNPAGQPTWAEVVGFETAVATDNALRGALAWVTTSAVIGFAKTTEKASGSGRFLMEAEAGSPFGPKGSLNGYPIFDTNAVAAGTMIFGNWSELLIGMWGVLDLMPDPYGAANAGALIIRAFQDIDIGVRHAESFCKNVLT